MKLREIKTPKALRTRVAESDTDGPVVVLLHGLANSIEIWERVWPALSMRFRLIAFDLPGFGEADRPEGRYDGPFFAAHVAAVCHSLSVDRAHFIGNSLGASILLHLHDHESTLIERAVLAAPGGFGRSVHPAMLAAAIPVIGPWLARPSPANNRRTLRLAINNPAAITTELVSRTDRFAARPGSRMSFTRSLTSGVGLTGSRDVAGTKGRAQCFAHPTLVIWGDEDRIFPPRYADVAVALLPDARLARIATCGHYPQWEKPGAFVRVIEEHLG